MKFPDSPRPGVPVEKTVRDILNYLRSITVTNMVGGRVQRTAGGTSLFVPTSRPVRGEKRHPWQATVSAEDEVTVAPGFMFGVVCKRSPGADQSGWDFVWVPTKYSGSTITAITETCYIYAKMSLYDGFNGGSNYVLHKTQETSEMDEAESRVFQPYGSITVYKSTNDPASEGISGGEEWIVPVAKVKVEDNVLTIEEQYLTHNPTQQLGYFTLQVTPPA